MWFDSCLLQRDIDLCNRLDFRKSLRRLWTWRLGVGYHFHYFSWWTYCLMIVSKDWKWIWSQFVWKFWRLTSLVFGFWRPTSFSKWWIWIHRQLQLKRSGSIWACDFECRSQLMAKGAEIRLVITRSYFESHRLLYLLPQHCIPARCKCHQVLRCCRLTGHEDESGTVNKGHKTQIHWTREIRVLSPSAHGNCLFDSVIETG